MCELYPPRHFVNCKYDQCRGENEHTAEFLNPTQKLDRKKLMLLMKEARRQGRDEDNVWIMLGNM
ncbi:MAG: hypothetical protein ACI4R9_07310 [Kiritimatiellia bacterium]